MKIGSNHTAALVLPNNQEVPAMGAVEVSSEDWEAMQSHAIVKAWLSEKKLFEGDRPVAKTSNSPSAEIAALRKQFDAAQAVEAQKLQAVQKLADDRAGEIDRLKAELAKSPGTGTGSGAVEDDLKAVHRGGGSYAIMKDDQLLKEGLNKADADAFNSLSAEEKAEYVKPAA